jgi:hypothetical protein
VIWRVVKPPGYVYGNCNVSQGEIVMIDSYEEIKEALLAKPNTWLITGVAGFIGSNLLEALLNLNLFRVVFPAACGVKYLCERIST